MPKKIAECTKAHLVSVALPNHAATYTVISHQSVIDYVYTELATAGFSILDEEFRCTADGQIAQGIHKLSFNSDPELSMMFVWTNSYNKQVRFKCGVGAYINLTGTTMVCGDMGNWARKHTGTADEETIKTIQEQIANAHMYYNQLAADKELMKTVILNKRRQAQMLGILFAEYQILTTEQASMIRSQMDRPSHVFTDSNSLWAFYSYVTIALQHSHPKTWMEDQRVLHYFMSSINNFQQWSQPTQIVPATPEVIEDETEFVDPNQTNLLDQIAAAEADLEADQMDEDLRYKHAEVVEVLDLLINAEEAEETSILYTDPMGNTFETIDFHNAVTADPEDDDDDNLDIWEEVPLKEEEPFEIDENQEWTGENASHMSLEVAPEDREQAELDITNKEFAEEKKIYEEDAVKTADFDDLVFKTTDNTEDEDLTSDFF
tara:strand:- start:2889 stop:4190 length:1302 start_codon:yes stop_codon:yes gene_type:complete